MALARLTLIRLALLATFSRNAGEGKYDRADPPPGRSPRGPSPAAARGRRARRRARRARRPWPPACRQRRFLLAVPPLRHGRFRHAHRLAPDGEIRARLYP